MKASEAKEKSKERQYTAEHFKGEMKNRFHEKDSYPVMRSLFTPAGVYHSETFVQDVVSIGYKIEQREDALGMQFYLISW